MVIPHRKKQKASQPQVLGIAEEDVTLLREPVAEVAEKTLGNIMSKKTNWTALLTIKVNRLAEAVTVVCDTM